MKGTKENNRVYLEYYKIEERNFQEKVSFFEKRKKEIELLVHKDKLELEIDYGLALFETGQYHKCLSLLPAQIEQVIIENIFELKGEDIYQKLLFKKAACHYNIGAPEKSDYILSELLRINPKNKNYTAFLKKCFRFRFMVEHRWISGLSIGLFLLVAAILTVELLIIRPFYNQYIFGVEIFRNSLFLISTLILIVREYFFFRAYASKLNKIYNKDS